MSNVYESDETPQVDNVSIIVDLGPAETLEVALDRNVSHHLRGNWVTAQDRLTAARQLLWQDPPAGTDAVLAQVVDVDIQEDDRLDVIRLAVDAGPAVHQAAGWLL